jgi:hypothetical protein
VEEEKSVWFSVRLFRKLHLGLPWWLAVFPFMFVTIAAFRERAPSHLTEAELAWPVARSLEMAATPVRITQPLVIEPPAFSAAADDWRTRVERLTKVLIALTVVMVLVSALVLTHG